MAKCRRTGQRRQAALLRLLRLLLFACFVLVVVAQQSTANVTDWRDWPVTNETSTVLLSRQRRFLVFEPGAIIFMQGNVGKSIVGTQPRGLNMIVEWTWTYALPVGLDVFWPKPKPKSQPMPKPSTTAATTTSTTEWPFEWTHWQPPQPLLYAYPSPQKWLKKAFVVKSRRPHCSAHNAYRDYRHGKQCLPLPRSQHSVKRRRYKRVTNATQTAGTATHSLLLDMLSKWAEFYDFQPRYCIMRTICESRHLLLPPGHSLFHDVLRILLRYAEPLLRQPRAYVLAYVRSTTLPQCAILYGPHCRLSFLSHFMQLAFG